LAAKEAAEKKLAEELAAKEAADKKAAEELAAKEAAEKLAAEELAAKEAAEKKAAEELAAKEAAEKKASEELAAKEAADKLAAEAEASEAEAKAKIEADEQAKIEAEAKARELAASETATTPRGSKKGKNKGGILKLTCQNAKIAINTDLTGKMDPFVIFELLENPTSKKVLWTDKTPIHKSGHKTPVWDVTFDIPLTDASTNVISFKVYEDDTFGKDFLGSGTFKPGVFRAKKPKEFQRGYGTGDKETLQLYLKGVFA